MRDGGREEGGGWEGARGDGGNRRREGGREVGREQSEGGMKR